MLTLSELTRDALQYQAHLALAASYIRELAETDSATVNVEDVLMAACDVSACATREMRLRLRAIRDRAMRGLS